MEKTGHRTREKWGLSIIYIFLIYEKYIFCARVKAKDTYRSMVKYWLSYLLYLVVGKSTLKVHVDRIKPIKCERYMSVDLDLTFIVPSLKTAIYMFPQELIDRFVDEVAVGLKKAKRLCPQRCPGQSSILLASREVFSVAIATAFASTCPTRYT